MGIRVKVVDGLTGLASWLTSIKGALQVTSPSPTTMSTTTRDGLDAADVYNGMEIRNSTKGYNEVYRGDEGTNVAADWEEAQPKVVNRAVLVATEKTGVAHNRNINDAVTTHPGTDATNTATWTTAEAVTELRISAINSSGTGAALQNDEGYLVVINAPSAATALTWLTDAGTAAQDVLYEMGHIGTPLVIKRTYPITRIDVFPLNIDMRFVIGAV